jgi:futalosine hydrolase
MNCLLAAATAPEISIFLDHYRHSNKTAFVDISLDVLITGVGLTATTYSLARQFRLKQPDLVIQAGIAGCFDRNIPLGSIVAVKQDTIADEGVLENGVFKTVFDLKLASPNLYPYKNGWLTNADTGIFKRNKYRAVKGISINRISTGARLIQSIIEKFDPAVETMEGAALHYTCLSEKTPFLQLRGISNYVGERNKSKWKMKEAIENLNKELIRLLEAL